MMSRYHTRLPCLLLREGLALRLKKVEVFAEMMKKEYLEDSKGQESRGS